MIERVKSRLDGKKILFIAPKFYQYSEAVVDKLRAYNAQVKFYFERDTSLRHVVVANLFTSKMDSWQQRHYESILNKTAGQKFDFLVVIRGFKMESWFVEKLKASNPAIETIMYQWDVFGLWNADYRHLIPYFDRTLSFDYKDCETLGIPYAPTFCMDEYLEITNEEPEIDFIYCANYTDEKYDCLKKLKNSIQSRQCKLHSHLYISLLKFLSERARGKKIRLKDVSFRRLNRKDYFNLFKKSRVIIDNSSSLQTGLTMRVIDALASGKRVLTNNYNVIQEPGYKSFQVIIYNQSEFNLPSDIFEEKRFEKLDYSIDKWLDNLLFAS